jgi:glycosyltransferase involved in cell wall biosynthesis
MRILQAMAGAVHGGAEIFFEDLAVAFARAGIEQHVVTRPAPERLAIMRRSGIATDSLAFTGGLDLYTRWRLERIARAYRPDVVMGWMNRACRALPRGDFARIGRLGGYYKLKNYAHCDALICNTRDIRDFVIREGWPSARAYYVPNFCPALNDPALPRTSFDTPVGAHILLILARLETVKGIDVAVRAMQSIPTAVLWIAGEGRLLPDLMGLARDIGVTDRVRFLGWRNDRAALLKAAHACLVPSRHEPFGNVVVNAWAHGVPVIAARSEGPSALICPGEDGLLVPIDDVQTLAATTNGLLADSHLATALIAGGRKKALAEYSESAVVSHYLEVFREAVERRN